MLDDQEGFIWVDGQMVDWRDAKVHVLTHTFHYGSGVFEGERAYDGTIFEMTRHHQRLHDSAKMMGFQIPYSVAEIDAAAMKVMQANKLQDAYIRPVAWHGAESLGVSTKPCSVHLAVAAWKWGAYFASKDGVPQAISLMWSDWVRPAPNMAVVHAKANGQYITGSLGKRKAEENGFNDALMLDYRGYVAECTGANIFYVKGGKVFTPIADCFLNGITRQTVIDLVRANGMACEEKFVSREELLAADEIFITGSAVEVQPIGKIGEQSFATGEVTRKLAALYQQKVHQVK